jgi:DNA modification methylase
MWIVKNDMWDKFVQKLSDEKREKLGDETDYFVAETQGKYLVSRELDKEEKKTKLGFNGLTPSEWALLSKNVIVEDDLLNPVWNDLSSPRNKYQLEHGAVYPIKLCERLIKMYSTEGDTVFDPFLGIGTTMIAAQQLNRHCIGTELNPKFAGIAKNWLDDVQGLFGNNMHYKIVNDDCRNLLQYVRKDKVQLTITSTTYADFIQKSLKDRKTTHKSSVIKLENNSTVRQYSGKENDFDLTYNEFLEQIKQILKDNFTITKASGYSCGGVKDYHNTKNKVPYVTFHSDLAQASEKVPRPYYLGPDRATPICTF